MRYPRGIKPAKPKFYLVTGTAVHAGIEYILSLLGQTQWEAVRTGQNEAELLHARRAALSPFSPTVDQIISDIFSAQELGIDPDDTDAFRVQKEQRFLASMLVACWAWRELPVIVERYTVENIELDIARRMTIEKRTGSRKDIILEIRPDAILRDRLTGNLVNYSLKTTGGDDETRQLAIRNSLQVVTEGSFPGVAETRICALNKSYRKMDDRLGFKRQNSRLAYGYYNEVTDEWAHDYYVANDSNKSGKGQIPRGYWLTPVYERLTPQQWFTMIRTGKTLGFPTFHDVLDETVLISPPAYTSESELEETLTRDVLHTIRAVDDPFNSQSRNRRACFYPSWCPYTDVCFRGRSIEGMLETGEIVWREPHHEIEMAVVAAIERGA
jgi:hypothetical protein